MNRPNTYPLALAAAAVAFALGALASRWSGPVEAQVSRPAPQEYRVLQDRELYSEAAATRKEELQEKLNKLAAEGWEIVNPSATYVEDKGFLVVTGSLPRRIGLPDPSAVLLLRREAPKPNTDKRSE